MELFLLYLSAFLRPLLGIDFTQGSSGSETSGIYNVTTAVLTVFLGGALFMNASLRRNLRVSAIDLSMAAFAGWCVAVYFIYYERAVGREVLKLIFPLFVYFVVKNVLTDREQYRKMIWLMIAGFTVPVALSTALVLQGKGVAYVRYWTDIPRYQGAYSDVHNFSHNMLFLLMLIAVYVVVSRFNREKEQQVSGKKQNVLYLGVLGLAALYCLIMTQARTQLLGLIVFFGYTLLVYNRRALYLVSALSIVLVIVFAPIFMKAFFWDYQKVESGVWSEDELGAGRPKIWKNNLNIFEKMPLDRQLGGVGIGNKEGLGGTEGITDSHNDFLDVMIQTGMVGLLLYLLMQALLLRKILQLPGKEKHVFVAMFISVAMMNISSNSYITRSAIAQLYFLTMAYVELRKPVTS